MLPSSSSACRIEIDPFMIHTAEIPRVRDVPEHVLQPLGRT